MAFLPDYAAEVLRGLEAESDDLAKRVGAEREIGGDLIVPRLAFPQWIPDWIEHPWPEGAGLRTIAEACQRLRGEGFATAIGMPFAEKRSHEEAVRQVDELSPEFLLLVECIGRLEIEIEGRPGKVWTCEPSNQRQTILEGETVLSCWRVSTFDGVVPEDLLDHAERTKNRFKFTLAVRIQGCLVLAASSAIFRPTPSFLCHCWNGVQTST